MSRFVSRLPRASGQERQLVGIILAALTCACLAGLLLIGPTPLNLVILLHMPLLGWSLKRQVPLPVILLTLAVLGVLGVVLNVWTGAQGLGSMAWLLLAPVIASFTLLPKWVSAISSLCVIGWLLLLSSVPADQMTSWVELRFHFGLILLASSCIAVAYALRGAQWRAVQAEWVSTIDTLLENQPVAVVLMREGALELANAEASRLLGWSPGDMTAGRAQDVPSWMMQLAEGDSRAVIDRNGEELTLLASRRSLESPQGATTILVLRDATEEHRQERARSEETRRRLESEKFEQMGRLAGGVAHDFNNLLTAIYANADLIQVAVEGEQPNADLARNSLAEIRHASGFAGDLVRQLLAYAGKDFVDEKEIDVDQEVDSTLLLVGGRAHTQDVRIERGELSRATLHCDPTRLRQVVMNLVANAIDACDRGGVVLVTTREVDLVADDFSDSLLRCRPRAGRFVEIEVCDDGVGIAQHQRSRLLEPFYTTRRKGSGLGLAAVAGILEAVGGALALDSELGEGSCFRAIFPVGREQVSTDTWVGSGAEWSTGRRRLA